MSSDFKREELATDILRDKRWGDNVVCVECSSNKVVKNGVREDKIQQYYCKKCGRSFNDRSGTIFSNTQMNLTECMYIMYNAGESSVSEISGDLGRSWKTVNDFIRIYKSSLISDNILDIYIEKASENVDYSLFGCGGNLYINKKSNHLQI